MGMGGLELAVIARIRITPDSKAIAFQYLRRLSNLYVLDELAPSRR